MDNSTYLQFLDSCEKARAQLVADSKNARENNPDLYDAFWSDYDSEIYRLRTKLYELKWIDDQWKNLAQIIAENKKKRSKKESNETFDCWLEWYSTYLKNWQMTAMDINFLSVTIQAFDMVVCQHDDWEIKHNMLTTDLKRNRKKLCNLKNALRKENDNG